MLRFYVREEEEEETSANEQLSFFKELIKGTVLSKIFCCRSNSVKPGENIFKMGLRILRDSKSLGISFPRYIVCIFLG